MSVNLYSFLRKKHKKPFLGALFAVVFLSVFFITTIKASAQTPGPRPISDYLTLWGTDYNPGTKEAIKRAEANGIGYLGPKSESEGGFDSSGNLKKISTVISLTIDQSKYRGWSMVGGHYYEWANWGNNKRYLRLLDESFIARIYQKDSSGAIINEVLTRVPVCSFVDCDNSGQSDSNSASTRVGWAKRGVPSNRIVKYVSGSALGSNLGIPQEDGYTVGPDGAPKTIGGAATACGSGAAAGAVLPIGITSGFGCILGTVGYLLFDTDGPVLILRQTAIIDLPVEVTLEKGKTTYMEMWYLGSGRLTTSDNGDMPQPATVEQIKADPQYDKRIKYFDIDIESGYDSDEYPFFQIGGTYEFTTPTTFEEASNQATSASGEIKDINANIQSNDGNGFLPACDIANGWRLVGSANGTFMGCIAQLTYYAIYRPAAWAAGLMGELFDFFLGYSLADSSYRQPFIVDGWKIVRDISNIFFIIILIWTGLATVFNMDGISMKKIVPALIINALLINFSLFGTQVIIDISNITARIFYNSTQVCTGECKDENKDGTPDNILASATGYKSLSVAITSGFNPQRLFGADVINSAKSTPPKGGNAASNTGSTSNDDGDDESKQVSSATEEAGYFIIVCLIAAMIMFGVAKMFWGTAFMFLGRIIGLYIVMIFSPFAVVTRGNMPLIGKIPELSWSDWIKDLTSYALLAPIFVFFLYIISAFVQSGFMDSAISSTGDGFFVKVLRTSIPMLIVYFMLRQGVSIAKKYSGKFGELVQNGATKLAGIGAGVAIGVASGGTALLGRGVMSAANKGFGTWAATRSQDIRDANGNLVQARSSVAGGINKFLKWGNKTSFDVRNTGLGKNVTGGLGAGVLGSLGIKLQDNVSGSIGLGEKDYLGGNVKAREKAKKEKEKRIEEETDMSHLTDTQAQKVWENRSKKMNEQMAEISWEQARMKELESGTHTASGGLTTEKAAELKVKREEEQVLVKELEVAITSGNKDQQKTINEKLSKNADDQKALTVPLMAVLAGEKKGDKHKEKDNYKEAYKKAEQDTKNKYGDVKSAKDLSEVNRYAYQQRMLEDSLLLSQGKKRAGLWTLGLGVFSNYIDSEQQMELEVLKKGVSAFEKKHNKKDNRVLKLKADLEEIDNLIDSHIDETLADTGLKAKDLDADKRKTHLNLAKEKAQRDLREAEAKYEASKTAYEAPGTRTKEETEKHNEAVDAYYKAQDRLEALKNANKNRAKKEDDLARAEEEEARKADSKKPKGGDGGESGGGGKDKGKSKEE